MAAILDSVMAVIKVPSDSHVVDLCVRLVRSDGGCKRSSKLSSTSSEIVLDAEANEVDPAQASFDEELNEVEAQGGPDAQVSRFWEKLHGVHAIGSSEDIERCELARRMISYLLRSQE